MAGDTRFPSEMGAGAAGRQLPSHWVPSTSPEAAQREVLGPTAGPWATQLLQEEPWSR